MGILILALYPENWRQSLPGALFTALVGEVLFFVAVRAFGMAIPRDAQRDCIAEQEERETG